MKVILAILITEIVAVQVHSRRLYKLKYLRFKLKKNFPNLDCSTIIVFNLMCVECVQDNNEQHKEFENRRCYKKKKTENGKTLSQYLRRYI